MGWRVSAPAPSPSASGSAAARVAIVVIRIGRNRIGPRVSMASRTRQALLALSGW
jgi:hypothetical protein